MIDINKIKIGMSAIHIINGMTGVVTGKSKTLNGTVQYAITPSGFKPDGDPINTIWYDKGLLKSTEHNTCSASQLAHTDIILGNTVKHVSGFKGVALERIEYLNGCVYIGVMPKTDNISILPDMVYIPCQYLNIVKDKKLITQSDDTGGPSSKAPTM
jgi:hypothetical protein